MKINIKREKTRERDERVERDLVADGGDDGIRPSSGCGVSNTTLLPLSFLLSHLRCARFSLIRPVFFRFPLAGDAINHQYNQARHTDIAVADDARTQCVQD